MKLLPILAVLVSSHVPTLLASPQLLPFITSATNTASLSTLARSITLVESLREVKDVTRAFAQYVQFGHFGEAAALFANDGKLRWGNDSAVVAATGPAAIEAWLTAEAGAMDGAKAGALNTLVPDNPVVTLAADGKKARGRWEVMRFQGDGVGGTKISGGVYENEYVLGSDGRWKIGLLWYYPMYEGPYKGGWRNVGGGALPVFKHHFGPDEAANPIIAPSEPAPATNVTAEELEQRIENLNDEDSVRNLQHAYGYYVDRRMWADVVDLYAGNASFNIDGVATYAGQDAIRKGLEARMGPAGLSQGVLNEYLIFDAMVKVDGGGKSAVARGIIVALFSSGTLGGNNTGRWQFGTFRNSFVKEDGIWKLAQVNEYPLVAADYAVGWGMQNVGVAAVRKVPEFVEFSRQSGIGATAQPTTTSITTTTDLADLERRLRRSLAWDASDNVSAAYGFSADDEDCTLLGGLHASLGHKESPFAGWWRGQDRVTHQCVLSYGEVGRAMRDSVSFHWRPQAVIVVSQDGRSASVRTRLFQPSTSKSAASGLRGGMYNDQTVQAPDGSWRLWSVTIDEFFWESADWAGGWAASKPRAASQPDQPAPRDVMKSFPPDVALGRLPEREKGFMGGAGRYTPWPQILRMWFAYRNPVSGKLPQQQAGETEAGYWPGCAPCGLEKSWSLVANGYQEPPTGPTLVTAVADKAGNVAVTVAGGPDEDVRGVVEIKEGGKSLVASAVNGTTATLSLPMPMAPGNHALTAIFTGSDRLASGQTSFTASFM